MGVASLGVNLSISAPMYAHGTEQEHEREQALHTFLDYGLIVSLVMITIGVILWVWNRNNISKLTKAEKKQKLAVLHKKNKRYVTTIVVASVLFVGMGIVSMINTSSGSEEVTLTHIHGLGYANKGEGIYVAAHDGIKVYEDNKWSSLNNDEPHDYMGFTAVDDGFYSSGHPALTSSMKNPFGVMKVTDQGSTLEPLSLYGEIDFHLMGVGYVSHAIYVDNPAPNAKMSDTGLYYSVDNASTWTKSDSEGLPGEVTFIAAHPTQEHVVVVATDQGAFYSGNYGQQFEPLVDDVPVTSVAFDSNGDLYAALYNDTKELLKINTQTKENVQMNIPQIDADDAIAYIAVHPENEQEMTFATFKKHIYVTQNNGEAWDAIF